MFEMNLEPWERISEEFEKLEPLVRAISFPLMPEVPEVGKMYRIYPEGCVSGNGTAYHGNVRIGKNPKKLLIFFNGGGVAFDEYTVSRPNNAFTGHIEDTYYSNDGEWLGDYFMRGGINADREDNPFREFSCINLPYCNGDFHCGNGEFPYTAQDGSRRMMPFHGHRNAMAVIEMAKKYLPEPEQILIAGSSAGGFGVALLSEDVIEAFPNCQNVTCVVDGSFLLSDRWDKIARDVWHAPEHICRRLKTNDLMLDSYLTLHEKYGDRVRYLFDCSPRDALLIQAQSALDGEGQVTDAARGVKFQKNLTKCIHRMREEIENVGLYIFVAPMDSGNYDESLTLHCVFHNPAVFDHTEEGISPCQWVINAMAGDVRQIGLAHLDEL